MYFSSSIVMEACTCVGNSNLIENSVPQLQELDQFYIQPVNSHLVDICSVFYLTTQFSGQLQDILPKLTWLTLTEKEKKIESANLLHYSSLNSQKCRKLCPSFTHYIGILHSGNTRCKQRSLLSQKTFYFQGIK